MSLLLLGSALAADLPGVTEHKPGHRTYHSEIVIDAPPAAVWAVLTDFDSYPEWSTIFARLEGDFRDGGTVTTWFEKKPGNPEKLRAYEHVVEVVPGQSFSWSDPFAMGMVDHHVFTVEAVDDGTTRFVHSDEARGGMTWLFGRQVSRYHASYPRFNIALEQEVKRREAERP